MVEIININPSDYHGIDAGKGGERGKKGAKMALEKRQEGGVLQGI